MSHRLSVCAIVRDEAPYLAEWIEFHRLVGVESFYLYDNGSQDGTEEVLAPYRAAGVVQLKSWPQRPGQLAAYKDCLAERGAESQWIAFLDADEFLFPTVADDLCSVLAEFEDHPAVAVNWLLFGSSGHRSRPPGLQIEAFTRRAPEGYDVHRHVKCIVRPERTMEALSPHHFRFAAGAVAVAETGRPVTGPLAPEISVARLRINHYFTRSLEEAEAKRLRGRADTTAARSPEDMAAHDRGEVEDLTIRRFVPALREKVSPAAYVG